ncbi:SDR family NAD(P)-dependent oxidoreductase [Streptacidiphilus sp. PAMC 29251]
MTNQTFTDKVVLITGGGHGIGAVTAAQFAAAGAHVVLGCFRDPAAAEATLKTLPEHSAEIIQADVRDREAVHDMFATVRARHGRLDILVNNAASGVFRPVPELTPRNWERAMDTNFKGTLWCTEAAVPLMTGEHPAVVNLSSVGVAMVLPYYGAAGASKAAIENLTRYHAAHYGPLGIRVNTASSGLIAGDNDTAHLPRQVLEAATALTPMGRLGRADELAALVLFLASPAASWITGQTICADGGMTTGYLAAATSTLEAATLRQSATAHR